MKPGYNYTTTYIVVKLKETLQYSTACRTNKNPVKITATAGDRTPINCLEDNYANHYTTVAPCPASLQ